MTTMKAVEVPTTVSVNGTRRTLMASQATSGSMQKKNVGTPEETRPFDKGKMEVEVAHRDHWQGSTLHAAWAALPLCHSTSVVNERHTKVQDIEHQRAHDDQAVDAVE